MCNIVFMNKLHTILCRACYDMQSPARWPICSKRVLLQPYTERVAAEP